MSGAVDASDPNRPLTHEDLTAVYRASLNAARDAATKAAATGNLERWVAGYIAALTPKRIVYGTSAAPPSGPR